MTHYELLPDWSLLEPHQLYELRPKDGSQEPFEGEFAGWLTTQGTTWATFHRTRSGGQLREEAPGLDPEKWEARRVLSDPQESSS